MKCERAIDLISSWLLRIAYMCNQVWYENKIENNNNNKKAIIK